jgi:DNA polymerase-3 subunit gamma/tau
MAQQSLYRRYRPGRFSEIRGQEHVVSALQNSIAAGSEGHAYLFSGPRGTGKTTTARILAKALNCTDLTEGEPCGKCESCLAIEAGNSYDLFELDAASHNGVDAMRDLVARAAVGSPGRTKVYILDEVHMLSAGASNALLKTLEEPPDHVVFVLATTDPHKVLPTIRSRTQHYEFTLLTADQLSEYAQFVAADAGLDVDADTISQAVRDGHGSARDMLSSLEQLVAAGGLSGPDDDQGPLLDALAERDGAAVIVAIAASMADGRDPRVIAESVMTSVRDAFLVAVGADVTHLSEADAARADALAKRLGAPSLTRTLESLGGAIVEMRQSADPRIPLEVALLRVADPTSDLSLEGLADRIKRLERVQPASAAPAVVSDTGTPDSGSAAAAPAASGAPASAARAEIKAKRESKPPPSEKAPAPPTPPAPPRRSAPSAKPPTPQEDPASKPALKAVPEPEQQSEPALAAAPAAGSAANADLSLESLNDAISAVADSLKPASKAVLRDGQFTALADGKATFELQHAPRDVALKRLGEIQGALSTHLGHTIEIELRSASVDAPDPAVEVAPVPAAAEHEHVDITNLDDATDATGSGVDKIVESFPGAVVVDGDEAS